jgi:DNA-binding beta-propeller fold protein YncE
MRIFAKALIVALIAFSAPSMAGANPSIPGSETTDGLIWLPTFSDGSVQGIDPVSKQVVATIPGVADHPINAKINAEGTLLFVNSFGPTKWDVNVVDLKSRTVVKRIPTTGPAWATTAFSHDLRYLYVPTALSVVDVIDTTTLEVVRTLPIWFPPGGAVHMEVSKDNQSIYAMHLSGLLTKYDAITGAVLAPPLFLYGLGPGWGMLSDDGDTLYSVNAEAGITAVDTKGWYVKRSMFEGLFSQPLSATLSPDGSTLWVCNFSDRTLLVLDAHTFDLKQKLYPNGTPVYVGFSNDGTKAYLSNFGASFNQLPDFLGILKLGAGYFQPFNPQDSTLDVYDTSTYQVTDQIKVASAPMAGVYPG